MKIDLRETPGEAITQPGDLWTLGDHRVMCGDSTNADDVAMLVNGEKPDCALRRRRTESSVTTRPRAAWAAREENATEAERELQIEDMKTAIARHN